MTSGSTAREVIGDEFGKKYHLASPIYKYRKQIDLRYLCEERRFESKIKRRRITMYLSMIYVINGFIFDRR